MTIPSCRASSRLLLFSVILLLATSSLWAASGKVLRNFPTNIGVDAPLLLDDAGNLYGTTVGGGPYDAGTAYMLTPSATGPWKLSVLHSFGAPGDGINPFYGLVEDGAGSLYGTTYYGGFWGYGAVFKLSSAIGGEWTSSVIHSFNTPSVGIYPSSGLIFDAHGNLYGEAGNIAYELSPQADGTWSEITLHTFGIVDHDGDSPSGGLTFDTAGNLYGTTGGGGNIGGGTVFELSPSVNGGWTEQVLHSFDSPNFVVPLDGVAIDSAGNLYGVTYDGGSASYGSVYQGSPGPGGTWTFKTLHSFSRDGVDGSNPSSRLAIDAAGKLYGTT
ncbi:MAG: hypothetical protein H0X25_21835, partial [Acidobacteriales bacterium]|nr:hypothetical protein [Terriglobales bacterium]